MPFLTEWTSSSKNVTFAYRELNGLTTRFQVCQVPNKLHWKPSHLQKFPKRQVAFFNVPHLLFYDEKPGTSPVHDIKIRVMTPCYGSRSTGSPGLELRDSGLAYWRPMWRDMPDIFLAVCLQLRRRCCSLNCHSTLILIGILKCVD